MRYDTLIEFETVVEGSYNEATGDYDVGSSSTVAEYANVTEHGENYKKLMYGSIGVNSITVRLHSDYAVPFDYIVYDGKRYVVETKKTYKRGCSFICHEEN